MVAFLAGVSLLMGSDSPKSVDRTAVEKDASHQGQLRGFWELHILVTEENVILSQDQREVKTK